MQTGFVALLDVLGFASLVSADRDGELIQHYLQSLQNAIEMEVSGQEVDFVAFSDSIILTTDDDSEDALLEIARRCSKLFGLMLESDIALRGAIAQGSYIRSKDLRRGVFVAGKAIIDAYEYEKKQDWVGIMLAPSALRRVPDLFKRCYVPAYAERKPDDPDARHLPWAAFIQPKKIPFHGAEVNYSGFAIVPTNGIAEPAALRDSLSASAGKMSWLRSLAPDPVAQAKYFPAIELASETSERWLHVADHWARRGVIRPKARPGTPS